MNLNKIYKIYNNYNINKYIYFHMNLSVLFSQCTFKRFGNVTWTQGRLTSLRLRRNTLSGGHLKAKTFVNKSRALRELKEPIRDEVRVINKHMFASS